VWLSLKVLWWIWLRGGVEWAGRCAGRFLRGVEGWGRRRWSWGAIALYAGLGFIAAGRRGWYYKDPAEDAVLMRLELEKRE
jgi:hypothetical protein